MEESSTNGQMGIQWRYNGTWNDRFFPDIESFSMDADLPICFEDLYTSYCAGFVGQNRLPYQWLYIYIYVCIYTLYIMIYGIYIYTQMWT